jgi:hypothetical protein
MRGITDEKTVTNSIINHKSTILSVKSDDKTPLTNRIENKKLPYFVMMILFVTSNHSLYIGDGVA